MPFGILSTVTQILVITSVFYLGRMNFSVGWIVPLLLETIRGYSQRRREVRVAITQAASSMYESSAILMRLDDVPPWVLFPDVHRAEWINAIVKLMWPNVRSFVEKLLKDLQPKISKQAVMKNFKFITINLGEITPRITGIKVYDRNLCQDDVIIDLSVSYYGDTELSFHVNGAEGGIKNIQLEGTVRITLKSLMPQPPFFHGIEITFLTCPTFDYELLTVLAPLNMFAMGNFIREVIKEELNTKIVFPNKIYIEIKSYSSEAKSPPKIEGVIRVEVDSVTDMIELEGQFACTTVELGKQIVKSPGAVIENGTADMSFESALIKIHGENALNVSVTTNQLDETEGESVMRGLIDVAILSKEESGLKSYPLIPTGNITMKLSWLTLSSDRKHIAENETSALLEIFIASARKVPTTAASVFVQISIGDKSKRTKAVDAVSSTWMKHFTFLINDPKAASVVFKLIEEHSLIDYGQFIYNISDLMARKRMTHDLQAFPLLQASHDCELLLSIKISSLKSSSN